MSAPRVALVTGATGAVGPALVRHLRASGYQVRALVRTRPDDGVLPPDVELVVGDITDRAAVLKAATGATCVFHLAARLHMNSPTIAMQQEYERINVDGTRCVIEASRRAEVERVVFFSTIAVYGPSIAPQIHDERSPLRLNTLYARTKYEAEQIVLSADGARRAAPLGVVLRLAAVYGTRVKGNYARLARALGHRWFLPLGSGGNRRTLVYDEDVAAAAVLAANHPDAPGKIFNVTDGHIHTVHDILEAMSAALGRSLPNVHIPVGVLRLFSRTLADKYLEDVAVSGEKIQREIGFQPRVDLVEGWARALRAEGRAT